MEDLNYVRECGQGLAFKKSVESKSRGGTPPPPFLFCSLHISEMSVHVAFYPIYCTKFCQLNSDHCQNKETEGMVLPEVI